MYQKHDQKISIILNEYTFKQVGSMHYLGVDGDEHLTWEVHVKSLTRLLSYKLYTLNKASKFMNSKLLNMIYTRSI